MKTCKKCNIEKDDLEFSSANFNGGSGQCKLCVKIYNKEYKLKNKTQLKINRKEHESDPSVLDKKSDYWKNYYAKNKDKRMEYNRQYTIVNSKSINKKRTKSISLRKKNNPAFKLRVNCSSLVRTALKRNGFSKRGLSILKYLPYLMLELKDHLEKLFEPWMTWENYGIYRVNVWNNNDQSTWTWQIDHIIPQSKLPYTSMSDDNFQKCWALENLRPLSAKQNIIDGDR
jgi:hypothetical protein